MKSYNLSEDKIKICLSHDEIEILFGSFDMIDYDSPRSRAIIDSLICGALPERVNITSCEKVLIEVFPERDGCSIQVTKIYNKGRHKPESLRQREYILLFNNSEELTEYIKSLSRVQISYIVSSVLYKVKSRFALYLSINERNDFLDNVCEYGKVFNIKSIPAVWILEHGKLLYRDAVEKIYNVFG